MLPALFAAPSFDVLSAYDEPIEPTATALIPCGVPEKNPPLKVTELNVHMAAIDDCCGVNWAVSSSNSTKVAASYCPFIGADTATCYQIEPTKGPLCHRDTHDKAAGEACDFNGQCKQNRCVSGKCLEIVDIIYASVNESCGAQMCTDSKCNITFCVETAYCQANKCVPYVQNGEKCNFALECQSGGCVNGICGDFMSQPLGANCTSSIDCETNYCPEGKCSSPFTVAPDAKATTQSECSVAAKYTVDKCAPYENTPCSCDCTNQPSSPTPYCSSVVCAPGFCDCGLGVCKSPVAVSQLTADDVATIDKCFQDAAAKTASNFKSEVNNNWGAFSLHAQEVGAKGDIQTDALLHNAEDITCCLGDLASKVTMTFGGVIGLPIENQQLTFAQAAPCPSSSKGLSGSAIAAIVIIVIVVVIVLLALVVFALMKFHIIGGYRDIGQSSV